MSATDALMKTNFAFPFAAALLLSVSFAMNSTGASPLPDDVKNYLENGWIGDDSMLQNKDGNLPAFKTYVKANWQNILDNFDAVAPTAANKTLVIAATQGLPPVEYLTVLEKLVQLSQAPNFDVSIWRVVVTPTKLKEGFLAYNYQNARVVAVIHRILATIPANDPQRQDLQKIRSGEAKEDFVEFNTAYNDGNVNRIALPPQ